MHAIGTNRDGALHRVLPFFSRVNLGNHATTIRQTGLDLALARIVLSAFREEPMTAIPEQRVTRGDQLELFES